MPDDRHRPRPLPRRRRRGVRSTSTPTPLRVHRRRSPAPPSPTSPAATCGSCCRGPLSSAGRAMTDGERPTPGGWNRIHLIVDDIEGGGRPSRRRRRHVPQRGGDRTRGLPGPRASTRPATWSSCSSRRRTDAQTRPRHQGDTMTKQTLPTRALLACGAVAGPVVRDGDDGPGAHPRRLRPEAAPLHSARRPGTSAGLTSRTWCWSGR